MAKINHIKIRGNFANIWHCQQYCFLSWIKGYLSAHEKNIIIDRFNKKNVVLTITAGRSGSDTLSKIFSTFPDLVSKHEPMPQYRYIMEKVQANPKLAKNFFMYVKAPSINKLEEDCYLETSHLYCKGFFEPSIAVGFRPSFIFLERDLRVNALSHLRKNAVPGRTTEGRQYLIFPGKNVYVPIRNPYNLSDYQLCFWYCLEISHRQVLYRRVCNKFGLKYFNITTHQLNDREVILSLAKKLCLTGPFDNGKNLNIGKVYNATPNHKKIGDNIDFEKEEKEVFKRIIKYTDENYIMKAISRYKEK